MIINNVELPNIDVADAFVMEHYEAALDKVVEKTKFDTKGKRQSEVIRIQCEAVFDFFDEVFGEGTAKKVFGESVNLIKCLDAFDAVVSECNKIKDKITQRYKSKYENHQMQKNHNSKGKKKNYNHYKPKLVTPAQK